MDYTVWFIQESLFIYMGWALFVTFVWWTILYGGMRASKKTVDHKTNVDALIGKQGIVLERIADFERGLVKIGGEVWLAESGAHELFLPGEYVEIMAVVGCHVVVKKIDHLN